MFKPFLISGVILSGLFTSCSLEPTVSLDESKEQKNDTLTITILQTADIHGQLSPHMELFWENDSIIFRERGGLAHIKTLFDQERKKNPGRTFVVDGGDFIQGSGYATLSEGSIFPDLVRMMNFDLLIPGNWEVVYGKEKMLDVLNAYNTPVIAQNMFHEADGENLIPFLLHKRN